MNPSRPWAVAVLVAALALVASGCSTRPKPSSGSFNPSPGTLPATTVAPNADDAVGLDWGKPHRIDSQPLVSVSCPKSDFCVATDQAGDALTYDGTSWSPPAPIGPNGVEATQVSCVAAGFCAAVLDQGADIVTYSASKWSNPVSPGTSGYNFNALSCASPTFCVAVGDSLGNATSWHGSTWGDLQSIDPGGNLTGVSCPTSSFCAAINLDDDQQNPTSAGTVFFDGSSWSRSVATPNGFGDGQSISCTSARFCVAIDNGGVAAVYNGTRFGSATPIDTADIDTLDGAVPGQTIAVSCTRTTFCLAVDGNGNALVFDGSRWSPPGPIDTGNQLNDVTCATSLFCVAVDQEGNVVVGT
jgi:hypothetical protein